MQEVLKSEWAAWKRSKVTRFIVESIVANRTMRLEEIAHGDKSSPNELYLEIGRCQGIEDVVHFMAEEIKEFLIDDEGESNAA